MKIDKLDLFVLVFCHFGFISFSSSSLSPIMSAMQANAGHIQDFLFAQGYECYLSHLPLRGKCLSRFISFTTRVYNKLFSVNHYIHFACRIEFYIEEILNCTNFTCVFINSVIKRYSPMFCPMTSEEFIPHLHQI